SCLKIPVRRSCKFYVFLGSNTFFSKGSLRLKTVFPWELTIFSIVYGRIFTPPLANMAYPLTISSTDTEAVPKASEATGGTSLEIQIGRASCRERAEKSEMKRFVNMKAKVIA